MRKVKGERGIVLGDGCVRWVRKATKTKAGGPRLILPAELRSWAGCKVEVKMISPTELVLRLIEDEKA